MTTEQIIIASLLQRIQELEQQTKALEYENNYDALTGCLNKRALKKFKNSTSISVIAIDVPGVSRLNVEKGHVWVDNHLQSIAAVLKQSVRKEHDCVYRFGGDEFCILLDSCNIDENLQVRLRILDKLPNLYIGCSSAENVEEALKQAFKNVEKEKLKKSKKLLSK